MLKTQHNTKPQVSAGSESITLQNGTWNIIDRIDLRKSEKLDLTLPGGYHITAKEGYLVITDAGYEEQMKRFTLAKGNLILLDTLVLCHVGELLPDGRSWNTIWDTIESVIIDDIGETEAEWLSHRVKKDIPSLIPPWERTTPARRIVKPGAESPETLRDTLNDDGNATRFTEEAGDWIIFDKNGKPWIWDETHYRPDKGELGRTERFVATSLRYEYNAWKAYADSIDDKDERARLYDEIVIPLKTHLNYIKGAAGQKNMRTMVIKSQTPFDPIKDTDYTLLARKNGIVNTATGEIYPLSACAALRERKVVRYIDRIYFPHASPSTFRNHVFTMFYDNVHNLSEEEAMNKAVALSSSFIRILGYALHPSNPEQIFLWLAGSGNNGKSTAMAGVRRALGDEYAEANIAELYAGSQERPSSSIARGLSARLLVFPEGSGNTGKNAGKIDSGRFKILTGESETLSFREMYSDAENRAIVALPVGVTNFAPVFDNGEFDKSLMRRMRIIAAQHDFSLDTPDRLISEKIAEEADEIYSLFEDELRCYLAEGLIPVPERYMDEAREIFAGYGPSQFIRTCLEKSVSEKMTREEVKELYLEWSRQKDNPVSTVFRDAVCRDAHGFEYQGKVDILSQTDTKLLMSALRIEGFNPDIKSAGKYYVNCVKRH